MNVGTIGTGGITTWFLTCWQETGNSCYAIYSRSQQSGEALRRKFQGNIVYTDVDAFLADERIDVVYVASPNSLHFQHAKQALLAGKHVILEKPFTSTIAECEELIQLAQAHDLFLMEGITVMDLPNGKLLASLLPEIGPVRMAVANMSKVSSKYHAYLHGEKPNVFQTSYSGGALMDLNVYNLHLMTMLFGLPEQVFYMARKQDGIDFSGCMTLRYPSHLAICIASKDSDADSFVEVQGELGYLHVCSASSTVSSIELHKHGDIRIYQQQEHELTHIYYLRSFLQMIKKRDFAERDRRLRHTLEVMRLLVEARLSAAIVFEADQ